MVHRTKLGLKRQITRCVTGENHSTYIKINSFASAGIWINEKDLINFNCTGYAMKSWVSMNFTQSQEGRKKDVVFLGTGAIISNPEVEALRELRYGYYCWGSNENIGQQGGPSGGASIAGGGGGGAGCHIEGNAQNIHLEGRKFASPATRLDTSSGPKGSLHRFYSEL